MRYLTSFTLLLRLGNLACILYLQHILIWSRCIVDTWSIRVDLDLLSDGEDSAMYKATQFGRRLILETEEHCLC